MPRIHFSRHVRPLLAAALCLLLAPAAGALTISDGVGQITVNDGDGSLSEFSTGGTDDLFAIVHFYRTTAMTAEASMIGQFADPQITSVAQIAPDTIRVQGSVSAFDYEMDYVLDGTLLTTNLTFTETNGVAVDLAMFSYQDWDVDPAGNDMLTWDGSTMTVLDPDYPRTTEITSVTPVLAAEAASFGPLLTSLLDGSPTSLTDGAGLPFGPGDATFALEYALSIPANGQTTVTTTYTLVPEPASGSLLGLGLGGLAGLRRRARRRRR